MITTYTRGQRVQTPLGPGSVVYQRMAPPDYRVAAAVSVRLDARAFDPTYAGTMFSAADVTVAADR